MLEDQIRIEEIATLDFDMPLAEPLNFGGYVIERRGYTIVSVRLAGGIIGLAVTLNRDAPLAALIDRLIAPLCVGQFQPLNSLASTCRRLRPAVLAAGIGLRAVSVLECAAVDAQLRSDRTNLRERFQCEPSLRPVTAVVGFPPTLNGPQVRTQIEALCRDGYKRFKLPVASSEALTLERLHAVQEGLPGAWVGLDLAWSGRSVEDVTKLVLQAPELSEGWLEDAFVPGRIDDLRQVGLRAGIPVAAGDDDGGPYFIEAAIAAGLDAVRVDATCQGGVFTALDYCRRLREAGRIAAPHLYHDMHGQILDIVGCDGPVEIGQFGTGVDPFGDLGEQPQVVDGHVIPRDFVGLSPLSDHTLLRRLERVPSELSDFLADRA